MTAPNPQTADLPIFLPGSIMADEILQEFFAETWDNLAQLDAAVVSLEQDPANRELLAGIFRTMHTLKGTCGSLGFTGLERVAHAAENVLGKLRDGSLAVNAAAISTVLESVDFLKELLLGLEATGGELPVEVDPWIRQLDELASQAPMPRATVPDPSRSDQEMAAPALPQKGRADLSIRVNVDSLDRLMHLVGELVCTRNQLLQLVRGEVPSPFVGPITNLDRVTTNLQQGVMQTRMQPVGAAWSVFPRLVRDLSRVTGKPIELEMQGGETELDRTVLDAIKEPLTHLIRNAADHGIETADVRRSAGKPVAGRLKLTASHAGGHVTICVEDDGAGINRERVMKKALEQGLITAAAAAQLPDAEIVRLIFRAGFSTADQVTSVSGRGVGMDVVRTEIERINGTAEVTSIPGRGTKVRIKIPLTMSILSALIVRCGEGSFAIPQFAIVEAVHLSAEERRSMELRQQHAVFRLRDRLLPLVRLSDVLNLTNDRRFAEDDIHIVVVQDDDVQFGLMVSDVGEMQEIVVKPAASPLNHAHVFQGTTILGDGQVIPILDMAGVAAQCGELSRKWKELEQHLESDEDRGEPISLLSFVTVGGATMAVPLAFVSRLEEIPTKDLERDGERLFIRYRGESLPILSIAGDGGADLTRELQPVVVFTDGPRSFGLIVDRMQDIIEQPLDLRLPSPQAGVLGTAILSGKPTEILDAQHYFQQLQAESFQRNSTPSEPKQALVIDDSRFFRQLVRAALESDGYRATVVESAERAIELLEQHERFDVILCDIEMPAMDGCQFAQWCRTRPDLAETPLVAITSLDSDTHGPRILRAGFDRLLIKFHPQQLRDTLSELGMRQDCLVTGLSA